MRFRALRSPFAIFARFAFLVSASALFVLVSASGEARAFCGFYVGGTDAALTNDATLVVLMREGTRTVLSMRNTYAGPPEDFALVVPVPVVLREANVKTLPPEIFAKVDQLTSPRLVEYWEQDPCRPPVQYESMPAYGYSFSDDVQTAESSIRHVKIEAQFAVGEYDVVVLSAQDSTGLDSWLRERNYKIPPGAEPYLRPYVQLGMKFFVAKVNVAKVRFESVGDGPKRAVLSPLRFHYDTDDFFLPVRLGLINSGGHQDLVAVVLARGTRYEVSNYDNVSIPTNLEVVDAARGVFGSFYAGVFDHVVAAHPHAVVTEYAWDAASCDPCPTPGLDTQELLTLGADVLPGGSQAPGSFVVTRLHARYARDTLGDDLHFRPAPPIAGGREMMGPDGGVEQAVQAASENNFQARYVIRHPWEGPIACDHPQRGTWGGPPDGNQPKTLAATNVAFAPRTVDVAKMIQGAVPAEMTLSTGVPALPPRIPPTGGCAGCTAAPRSTGALTAGASVLAILTMFRFRRRRP